MDKNEIEAKVKDIASEIVTTLDSFVYETATDSEEETSRLADNRKLIEDLIKYARLLGGE